MTKFSSPFYTLSIITMIASTLMTLSANNWMFIWLALEINLLSFIPTLMHSPKFQETEAAVKYFLVQSLGSSALLMSSMSLWFVSSLPINLMHILLIMSIVLKMGMAPCHMWFTSVLSSISWPSALILATWQKLAPLAIMAFMLPPSSPSLMASLAGLNALVGGVMGMNQTHLRTLMAYSSITHMGWMMALIYMNKPILTMAYFLMYSSIIVALFSMFKSVNATTIANFPKNLMLDCSFGSIQGFVPLLILSLGGLPPLAGFVPKWMTIVILSEHNPILLIVLILGSLMNLYYYLNILFSTMVLWPSLQKDSVYKFPWMGNTDMFMVIVNVSFGVVSLPLIAPVMFLFISYALILLHKS